MADRASRVLKAVCGLLILALAVPILALPVAVCASIFGSFGVVAVVVIVPILAAWLMIVVPLLAVGMRLLSPDLADRSFRGRSARQTRTRLFLPPSALHAKLSEEDVEDLQEAPAPRFSDFYGLRAPALITVAMLAVVATVAVWLAAG